MNESLFGPYFEATHKKANMDDSGSEHNFSASGAPCQGSKQNRSTVGGPIFGSSNNASGSGSKQIRHTIGGPNFGSSNNVPKTTALETLRNSRHEQGMTGTGLIVINSDNNSISRLSSASITNKTVAMNDNNTLSNNEDDFNTDSSKTKFRTPEMTESSNNRHIDTSKMSPREIAIHKAKGQREERFGNSQQEKNVKRQSHVDGGGNVSTRQSQVHGGGNVSMRQSQAHGGGIVDKRRSQVRGGGLVDKRPSQPHGVGTLDKRQSQADGGGIVGSTGKGGAQTDGGGIVSYLSNIPTGIMHGLGFGDNRDSGE